MDAKTVFLFLVLHRLCIQALPVNNVVENSSCIQVTNERAKELHEIGEEFNDFINELADKHEDIDFTFVELKVENHDDAEDEEKETTLKITVNDCNNKAKNHPQLEENFENDDVHGNHKTDEPVNNIGESSNNRNDKNNINNKSDVQSQSNSKLSNTQNVIKTNKVESFEANVNESNKESTKVSKNISKSKISKLDTDKRELSDKKEYENNELESAVDSKDEKDKKIKKKNPNRHEYLNSSTEDDEKIKDKDTHTINRNIDNSNIVIYAPNIENTEIEIGSDYQRYANMQNILRKLTDKQARFQIPNPTKFYENPKDNIDYFSYQPMYDYDSYVDDAFRNNVSQKTNAYPENENHNFEFGSNDFDLGANFNKGLWLQ